jgi:hypothetical protein
MAAGGTLADPNLPLTIPMTEAGLPICTADCRSFFEEFYVRVLTASMRPVSLV